MRRPPMSICALVAPRMGRRGAAAGIAGQAGRPCSRLEKRIRVVGIGHAAGQGRLVFRRAGAVMLGVLSCSQAHRAGLLGDVASPRWRGCARQTVEQQARKVAAMVEVGVGQHHRVDVARGSTGRRCQFSSRRFFRP